MISANDVRDVIGSTVYGSDGSKLGKVGEVYLDDESGRPEWATVQTGLFGTKEAFVPLAEAQFAGSELRVPYAKDQVQNAPHVDVAAGHLSPAEEADLYRHYGAGDRTGAVDTRPEPAGAVGRDTSGPTTDRAMTRSEEQVRVGTERVETGRARLRKFVVTENVTETVPVAHEEVRLEREPITEANVGAALDGPAISEEEHEVTLHAERPVVQKEAVPVERVRLDTQTVADQEVVSEQVRKEQIEVDGVEGTGRR